MLQADPSIAFLCRSLDFGGAERQLMLLAAGLAQQGIAVKIITFYQSKSSGALPLPHHPKLTIVCLNKKGRWQTGRFLWQLWQEVKSYPVVHSYLTFPNILTVFLKILSPRTKIIWGIRASNMVWRHYDWLACTLAWLEKVLSRCADGLIINSWAGLTFLQQHGYRNRYMAVIPNGIDAKHFYPRSDRSLRREWGIADDAILIGLVGRLDPMKGHITFLRAAHHVLQFLPQARFVCVGNGSEAYQNRCKALRWRCN